MSAHAQPAPVGGKLLTPAFKFLLLVAAIGISALVVRFGWGLASATAMNDGYAFGIWIALDVVIGTAIGCGGYAMALLVYLLNQGKYHPLVRPAMLTGALGYTFAGVSIFIDVGRYWGIWKIPTYAFWWNFHSPLLEVALCVMTYIIVLWFEFSPALMEGFRKGNIPFLKSLAEILEPWINRAMPWVIALGILLPTMHQSSLGSVMALPTSKVHGLWLSGFLPLLFLINCLFIGFAAVVLESVLSSVAFKRPFETKLLGRAAPLAAGLIFAFLGIRFVDLLVRGKLGLAFEPTLLAVLFWLETLLVLAGAVVLLSKETQASAARMFRAGLLVLVAGILYRFDAYIPAYNPGLGWTYFPAALEISITIGLVAIESMIYLFLVKRFPVLSAAPAAATR